MPQTTVVSPVGATVSPAHPPEGIAADPEMLVAGANAPPEGRYVIATLPLWFHTIVAFPVASHPRDRAAAAAGRYLDRR